jgi:thioredoxin reductase (NADPH)
MEKRELVVIGAGPAGLTAAIYGRRAGLDVLVLERGIAGGQINTTEEIENWPGVQHATGPELSEMFRSHAEKFKTEFRDAQVSSVEVRDDVKVIVTDKGEIEAEAVILATGAYFRRLGCEGEAEHIGQGVSYCAVCDGAFFEDEEIAVVGGGNTAVEEGEYLTAFASKVYIIHRRDEFRADRAAVERALSNPKIVPVWNTVVEKIEGDGMVENLVLKNIKFCRRPSANAPQRRG